LPHTCFERLRIVAEIEMHMAKLSMKRAATELVRFITNLAAGVAFWDERGQP